MRLHDYLARTGAGKPLDVSSDTLRRLHTAHRETFLFENLSIQSGGQISVEPEDIARKFLDERRGGYCFEHNVLLAGALRDAGFGAVALLGRVRRGPPERWSRTHMVLRVSIGPDVWLADVGFGAIGLVDPIPLRHGQTSTQRGLTYELRRDEHVWVLAMRDASGDQSDLYEFSEDPQTLGDVVVANHYTSTHPDSVFRRTLTIQRVVGNERLILRNEILTRYRDGRPSDEPVTRAQLPAVARDLFGVELPAGPLLYESYEVRT